MHNVSLFEFVKLMEKSNARTNKDTLAHPERLLVHNMARQAVGLPMLSIEDFPRFDSGSNKYVIPDDSKLICNLGLDENENFDASKLDRIYINVERVDHDCFIVYRVVDEHGNDKGMISILSSNEVNIYVDHFPAEKKYYSSTYPIRSIFDFESDVARAGLKLKRLS